MNTPTSPNRSVASGIHRGVWIGGGLMALTIIALATTLVVKNNDGLASDSANAPVAPLAATPVAPDAFDGNSSVANTASVAAQPPVANAPVNESARPIQNVPPRQEAGNGWHDAPQRVAAAPVCRACGVVDGYSAVQVRGQNNGVGAVAGGLGGALVGSQIAGRNNHTLGGVIGAVGGGLLGNAIESHERTVTVYDVRVRMADGAIRTVRESRVPVVGQRVEVEGGALRALDGQG